MYAYYSCAFGNRGQLLNRLLCKIKTTKFPAISFACFICAAKFGVPDLLLPSRFRSLRDEGHLQTNEEFLIPLLVEVKAIILEQRLLKVMSDYMISPGSALLVFSRANKIKWTELKLLVWCS